MSLSFRSRKDEFRTDFFQKKRVRPSYSQLSIDPTAPNEIYKVGFRAFKSPYINACRVNSNILSPHSDSMIIFERCKVVNGMADFGLARFTSIRVCLTWDSHFLSNPPPPAAAAAVAALLCAAPPLQRASVFIAAISAVANTEFHFITLKSKLKEISPSTFLPIQLLSSSLQP